MTGISIGIYALALLGVSSTDLVGGAILNRVQFDVLRQERTSPPSYIKPPQAEKKSQSPNAYPTNNNTKSGAPNPTTAAKPTTPNPAPSSGSSSQSFSPVLGLFFISSLAAIAAAIRFLLLPTPNENSEDFDKKIIKTSNGSLALSFAFWASLYLTIYAFASSENPILKIVSLLAFIGSGLSWYFCTRAALGYLDANLLSLRSTKIGYVIFGTIVFVFVLVLTTVFISAENAVVIFIVGFIVLISLILYMANLNYRETGVLSLAASISLMQITLIAAACAVILAYFGLKGSKSGSSDRFSRASQRDFERDKRYHQNLARRNKV